MGCGASDESPKINYCDDDLYAQNFKFVELPSKSEPKREQFMRDPNFSDADYKKLWQILTNDRVSALVIFMEQQKNIKDPFIEISTYRSNEYWNFAHFCCKHNAVRCLQWILTDAFYQKPANYINFVNAKNSDDQTPFAISLNEKSTSCSNLLLKFGGLNLKTKCKNQGYVELASVNRQHDIWKKLKQLQQMGVPQLKVHDEQFDIQSLSTALKQSKQQATKRIQEKNSKFDLMNSVKLIDKNIGQNQIQISKQFEMNTKQLEKMAQDFYKQMSGLNDQNQKRKDLQRKKLEQEKQAIAQQEYALRKAAMQALEKKKDQQAKIRLQMQQKKKEEQIRQRQLLQQANKQDILQKRADTLILVEQQRLNEMVKINQEARNQKLKNVKTKIQQNKQEIKKKVDEQNVVIQKKQEERKVQVVKQAEATETRKYGDFSKIPQDLQNMYNSIKPGLTFSDPKFPHENSSLGNPVPQNLTGAVWLRAHQIFKTTTFKLFDGIDPNDITQGSLGVCYYLSTISCLAQSPKRIQNLFAFADLDKGFYVVKLYTTGRQDYIVVDDYFPSNKMSNSPLFTKPRGNQIWVMVLEKAWVKQFGTYLSAESMSPDMMMENVTGAPSQGIWIDKHSNDEIFNLMKYYDQNQSIMVLTSHSQKKIEGIVACHAYSLISVYQVKEANVTHRLYKIRNPWGKLQWDGQYGDKSKKWTPQLKKTVGFEQTGNDGVFYMSLNQLSVAFSYISVGMVRNGYQSSYIDLKAVNKTDMFYQLKVTKPGPINLRVCQPFKRFAPKLNPAWNNYEYSPLIFEIFHVQNKKFLDEGENGSNFGAKSVNCNAKGFIDVPAGTLLVRIKLFSKMTPIPNMTLCTYAQQKISIKQTTDVAGFNLWQQCMGNFMSTQKINKISGQSGYALKWIKGQLLVYVKAKPNEVINFTLNKATLQNCVPGFLSNKSNPLILNVGNGEVGTVDKIIIKDACSTGSFSLSVTTK